MLSAQGSKWLDLALQGPLSVVTYHHAGATQLEMGALRVPSNDTTLHGKLPSSTPVRPEPTS